MFLSYATGKQFDRLCKTYDRSAATVEVQVMMTTAKRSDSSGLNVRGSGFRNLPVFVVELSPENRVGKASTCASLT